MVVNRENWRKQSCWSKDLLVSQTRAVDCAIISPQTVPRVLRVLATDSMVIPGTDWGALGTKATRRVYHNLTEIIWGLF